jgi:cytochrome c peroxidase
LPGAYNLGRCHSDRTGFEDQWVNNPARFSNTYFRLLMMYKWKRKRLENEVEQYVCAGEDLDEELVMLPTDIALLEDRKFRVWVERYARDKDLFFAHFTSVLAKLTELSIRRDEGGRITNTDNEKGGYLSAPKKTPQSGASEKS